MNAPHPWNVPLQRRLLQNPARLPHALLLSGAAGLGKDTLALALAQGLLCDSPDRHGYACGACKGCTLYSAGNHPDFQRVAPLDGSRIIAIEQIRALMEFITLRPHTAKRKIVVLTPAEAMNPAAANSLLKMLEEPPPANHLLLVTHNAAALLPTIRSRCHRLAISVPTTAEGCAWLTSQGINAVDAASLLALVDGAPLRALTLETTGARAQFATFARDFNELSMAATDVSTVAARWKKAGTQLACDWLQAHAVELIHMRMGGRAMTLPAALQGPINGLNLNQLFAFYDEVGRRRSLLGGPLDEQLLLEDTLIIWVRLITAATKAA